MNKKTKFKKVLVMSNPAATNAGRLENRLRELKDIFSDKQVITFETSKDGLAENRSLLLKHRKHLGPDTLFCIAAGDGTVNFVTETLLTEPAFEGPARHTVILPLWCGNANDMAHMLNGNPWKRTVQELLEKGQVVQIVPLRITLDNNSEKNVKIATSYAGFGATAHAVHKINTPEHRNKPFTSTIGLKLIVEFYTVTKAFFGANTFKVEENGERKDYFEYLVVNGSRIAKVERMPVRLNSRAFYVAKISRKHPVALLYALRIVRQRRFGRITNQPRSLNILEQTRLQTDGEVIHIAPNTQAEISLNPEPFYALSTRLRAPS